MGLTSVTAALRGRQFPFRSAERLRGSERLREGKDLLKVTQPEILMTTITMTMLITNIMFCARHDFKCFICTNSLKSQQP